LLIIDKIGIIGGLDLPEKAEHSREILYLIDSPEIYLAFF